MPLSTFRLSGEELDAAAVGLADASPGGRRRLPPRMSSITKDGLLKMTLKDRVAYLRQRLELRLANAARQGRADGG
jgi:hypothetical protein